MTTEFNDEYDEHYEDKVDLDGNDFNISEDDRRLSVDQNSAFSGLNNDTRRQFIRHHDG